MSKPNKTKQLCRGCHDDYYNQNREEGCWLYKTGNLIQLQRVGTWQPPPYAWHPEWRLSCYHPEGSSMLRRDDPTIREEVKA